MNDIHLLPRLLEIPLRKALKGFPIVVITGARQTGKSTLVRSLPEKPARTYFTLDDLDILERARMEPDSLVRGTAPVTLDEVQRSPDLLLAVKRTVDKRRSPGRFILTGSANLLLMKQISETLAGRAVHLTLWPLSRRELHGLGTPGRWGELVSADDEEWHELLNASSATQEDWRPLSLKGGYPTPSYEIQSKEQRAMWFTGYAKTYLERDLSELSAVSSLVDFRRLMRAVCLRLGNLVNQTEIARDVGQSQPTVHRHLNLMEISYQLVTVPAFAVNRTKRLIKSPKIYWSDTGLAIHLSGETEPRGAHLENLILCDLLAWRETVPAPVEILYWRTTQGEEVDFIVEHEGRHLPIEIKATSRPRVSDARSLKAFMKEYPDTTRAGLLLHAGSKTYWLAENVLAAPWWTVV